MNVLELSNFNFFVGISHLESAGRFGSQIINKNIYLLFSSAKELKYVSEISQTHSQHFIPFD